MIAIERSEITNQAKLQEEARQEILEQKGAYEGDARIREVLDKIQGPAGNFSLLQSILNRHLEKSGVIEPQDINDFLILQMPKGVSAHSGFMNC